MVKGHERAEHAFLTDKWQVRWYSRRLEGRGTNSDPNKNRCPFTCLPCLCRSDHALLLPIRRQCLKHGYTLRISQFFPPYSPHNNTHCLPFHASTVPVELNELLRRAHISFRSTDAWKPGNRRSPNDL